MLSNLSMNEDGMKNILIVVVVALVLYLLVTYIKDHKHKEYEQNDNGAEPEAPEPEAPEPEVGQNSSNGYYNYEGYENHGDEQSFGLTEDFGGHEKEHFGGHEKEHFGGHQKEHFEDNSNGPDASMGVGRNDSFGTVEASGETVGSSLPAECYPKEVLSSQDLMPGDSTSKFAQTNPSGAGSLADKNFLTAGFHVGVNTVGQSLRNANRQLRSDPPNPQVKVSPWMQTTIEPDVNRKPLEIGGN